MPYLEEFDDPATLRDRLAIRLAGECGLRVGELLGLKLEDVFLEERLLTVTGKGGRKRTVPLPRSLLKDLEHWMRAHRALSPAGETYLLLRSKKNGRLGKRLSPSGLVVAYLAALPLHWVTSSLFRTAHAEAYRWDKVLPGLERSACHGTIAGPCQPIYLGHLRQDGSDRIV